MTTPQHQLETAEAEIARLHNIIAAQQKQVERLLDARDAEKRMKDELWGVANSIRVALKFNLPGTLESIARLLPRIEEVLKKSEPKE